MAETLVPVSLKLPINVLDELTAAVLASSGPSALRVGLSRSAAVKAAVDAFVLNARASNPPVPPVARQRSRAIPVPIARRATAG